MATTWDDDEQLLAGLAEALRTEREVPARFLELGRAAFAWRAVEAELAALTSDSAATEEPAVLRAMTFADGRVTIELAVTAGALTGRVIPPGPDMIELRLRDGLVHTVPLDAAGAFTVEPRPPGPFRLHLRTATGAIRTEWTTL